MPERLARIAYVPSAPSTWIAEVDEDAADAYYEVPQSLLSAYVTARMGVDRAEGAIAQYIVDHDLKPVTPLESR